MANGRCCLISQHPRWTSRRWILSFLATAPFSHSPIRPQPYSAFSHSPTQPQPTQPKPRSATAPFSHSPIQPSALFSCQTNSFEFYNKAQLFTDATKVVMGLGTPYCSLIHHFDCPWIIPTRASTSKCSLATLETFPGEQWPRSWPVVVGLPPRWQPIHTLRSNPAAS